MTPAAPISLQPKFIDQTYTGEVWSSEELLIFFGAGSVGMTDLKKIYPDLKWAQGKQVHGNTVLFAHEVLDPYRPAIAECDGVISLTANTAASVLTADCLPILAWDSRRRVSAAIHAGWRGVVARIVVTAIRKLQEGGSDPGDLQWWIGPHIQRESFEVGTDVAEMLSRSTPQGETALLPHAVEGKSRVDLGRLVTLQIREAGFNGHVWVSDIDTLTDSRFASFRRSGPGAGRQVSFICSRR